jgi:uncharacterized caspase-like protein
MKRSFITALLLVSIVVVTIQAQQPRRVALVVGNGAYAVNQLKNPPNDASDVAAALKDAGFEVTLLKDADLTTFEKAVAAFATSLKGADSGLFYYAGHGVAVDGMNYLIPVSPRIDDEKSIKAKAVAVDTVVGKMEGSGVRTVLVFLDSCRDNPFPGASRSGTRGLAVVATPKSVNSLIAYATSPGDVAQDGAGRNGVFSGAFLTQLKQPGQELGVLMRNVKADVDKVTSGKQQPRVDDGMKEAFYFVSPEMLAARAQGALDASRAEVAKLEKELADRQAKISTTKDSQAKQTLEVEQQRQQAIAVAKRLELENLAREAEKQNKLAQEASAATAQKAALAAAQSKQQDELANLAAARRAELEKLAAAAASDNPDILIETLERLEVVLKEVDGQYAAALSTSLSSSNAGYDKQLASLSGQKPDITETDAEFKARVAKEKAKLEADRKAELARLRTSAESQRLAQTRAMRKQYDDTLRTLQTKVWTITGSGAVLSAGAFDRNTRLWPFTVASADPLVPMVPVQVVADLNTAPDPKAAILALDTAVKAGALIAEIDWGITRDMANRRYAVDVLAVRVRNLTTTAVVAEASPSQRIGYFTAGKRDKPIPSRGPLQVLSTQGVGDVYVDGVLMGKTPYTATVSEGEYRVEVRWQADPYSKAFSQIATVLAGTGIKVAAGKGAAYKIGDTGPAGGIIFFDKGKASKGWRFLESAPMDQSSGIQWSNSSRKDIATDVAIGMGRANTAAIIAAQGPGSYAASLCDSLVVGDYDDWFLPSKDELNLMYTNLKKAAMGVLGGVWFWSSSKSHANMIWGQNFSDGSQDEGNGSITKCAVRAVRAF